MSYEDEKSHNIAVSVGLNAAAASAANQKDPAAFFAENAAKFVGVVLDVHETFAFETVNGIMPGTVPVQAPFVPPAATSAPVAAATAPVAIPGATGTDDPQTAALWTEFFTDQMAAPFAKWYDNRTGKRNPKGPDFKNKADGDKALWLVGKKNPSWLPQALAQVGLA